MFFADTESITTQPTCIWLWGIKNSKNQKKYIGYNVKSLVNRLEALAKNETKSKRGVPKVYFFNAKWDNGFIIDYLLKNGFGCYEKNKGENGYFIPNYNNMGVCYNLEIHFKQLNGKFRIIKTVEAYNLIGGSIGEWGLKLGLPKGNTPLYKTIPKKIKQSDIDYLWRDIEILEKAYLSYKAKGMKKDTRASNALYQYKIVINKGKKYDKFREIFPILDYNLKDGYRGGWTFVNPLYKNKEVYNFYYYDVKSMYPDKLRNLLLPFGYPKIYNNFKQTEANKLYLYNVKIDFSYKPYVIPFIRIKSDEIGGVNYPKKYNGELQLTCLDLKNIKEHCVINSLSFLNSYEFESSKYNFVKYVDYWFSEKARCEAENDFIGVETAKVMLNALYGKFGSKSNIMKMEFYLKDDKVSSKDYEEEIIDPVYMPVAMFVTAHARTQMISACHEIGWKNVIYGDTDSIFSFEPLKNNVGSELGQWENKAIKEFKSEIIEKGTFFTTKQYALDNMDISVIKCAGLKKNVNELTSLEESNNLDETEPFVFNHTVNYSTFIDLIKNKRPISIKKRKTVNGGPILINSTFIPKFNENSITIDEYVS